MENVPGVIAGGVPGAGGYDALFFIIIDNESVRTSLDKVWNKYGVYGLETKHSVHGLLRS